MVFFAALSGSGAVMAVDAGGDVLDKGRNVFAQRCLHCHGENADGKGHLVDFLKVTPADLTTLNKQNKGSVTERVLKAVIGRHSTGTKEHKMPLLKDSLTPEDVYFVSEFIESIQK
ncbi:MAG: c-type cytochrome [Pseudomonadota bacterium]